MLQYATISCLFPSTGLSVHRLGNYCLDLTKRLRSARIKFRKYRVSMIGPTVKGSGHSASKGLRVTTDKRTGHGTARNIAPVSED